jgi:hypothetical protein
MSTQSRQGSSTRLRLQLYKMYSGIGFDFGGICLAHVAVRLRAGKVETDATPEKRTVHAYIVAKHEILIGFTNANLP